MSGVWIENMLSSSNTMLRWSPCTWLELYLGPSPFHAWSMSLVLNLVTDLVLPQYHCRFDDFFDTTSHNRPDIMTSATWKQLVGLCHADGTPTTREPLETFIDLLQILEQWLNAAWNNPDAQENFDQFWNIVEFPHDTGVYNASDNPGNSKENPVQKSEGATPINLWLPSAGTGLHGRQCKMSKAMVESVL